MFGRKRGRSHHILVSITNPLDFKPNYILKYKATTKLQHFKQSNNVLGIYCVPLSTHRTQCLFSTSLRRWKSSTMSSGSAPRVFFTTTLADAFSSSMATEFSFHERLFLKEKEENQAINHTILSKIQVPGS